MYRPPTGQMVIEDFVLPFQGKLDANNRWVKLSRMIPWERIETDYADLFPSNLGTVAKPLRMALGSLIIKERCGFTDRETVQSRSKTYRCCPVNLLSYTKEIDQSNQSGTNLENPPSFD